MKTLFILSLVMISSGVQASPETERYTRLLAKITKAHSQQIEVILNQQQRQIAPTCSLRGLKDDNLSVLVEPQFNVDAAATHGTWAVTHHAQACKQKVRRMVLFEANKDGSVSISAGPPGETLADPLLGVDAWNSFQKAAIRQDPTCNPKNMVLKDTKMIEEPSSALPYWREAWIGVVCGKEMGQVVSFYPTKAGTVFRMSLPGEDDGGRALTPAYQGR